MKKKPTIEETGTYNIVLGMAGPYGAGCSSLAEELEREVNDWPGCMPVKIHVASYIEEIYPFVWGKILDLGNKSKAAQRRERQKAGTKLRKKDPELVGKLICFAIHQKGLELEQKKNLEGIHTVVFLVDSLKNINEVKILRRIYQDEFSLLFVHADRETRWRRMEDYKGWEKKDRVDFETNDQIDQDEEARDPQVKGAGQQVGKLSGKADYYIVNMENREKLKAEGNRFLSILFGDSINQPNIHERSMHMAFSAANRSFCLSRQVGAAIVDANGNLLGIGHNDVPKAFGGVYYQDTEQDKRCYIVGDRRCTNDTKKGERFDNLTEIIKNELGLDERQTEKVRKKIEKSEFKDATEYCRAVHAEMEAILSVSRTGRGSTSGSTMYVTTEPCHNCIKHIVCAGISKVYFMEPYPKSLGLELHSDSIMLGAKEEEKDSNKVVFVPYHGVGPHRFHDFFQLLDERKDGKGYYKHRSKEDQAKEPRFALSIRRRLRDAEIGDPVTLEEARTYSDISRIYSSKQTNIREKGAERGNDLRDQGAEKEN